jgi:hypothetical protein
MIANVVSNSSNTPAVVIGLSLWRKSACETSIFVNNSEFTVFPIWADAANAHFKIMLKI